MSDQSQPTGAASGTDVGSISSISSSEALRLANDTIVKQARELRGLHQERGEIEQALGKALGYPEIDTPEMPRDGTVCVGDHTPVTLAEEAAIKLAALESKLAALLRVD